MIIKNTEWEKFLDGRQSPTGQIQIAALQNHSTDYSAKHERLILEAWRLKRAWLLGAAIWGLKLTTKELLVENYMKRGNKWLKRHIADLKDDFGELAKRLFWDWKPTNLTSTTTWMAEQYSAWMEAGFGVFDLGRVCDVERAIGALGSRRVMDCPPYAQVLLQGFSGAAIRHPEYHLATDLALLYNLFLDSEAINDEALSLQRVHCTEHSQSLARSVILTCFNLLESFTSGLATAFTIENPNAETALLQQLEGRKPGGRDYSLREKFALFPSLITGKQKLDENQPPLKELFGECKQRRDSFVHCEPGPKETKWGYVKEERFHEVDRGVVDKTVNLTCEAICLAWKTVHRKDKPSWLPKRTADRRFVNVRMGLRLLEAKSF